LRATAFEFRHRFWIIAALFTQAFALYAIDHRNAAVAMAARIHRDPWLAGARGLFAAGALCAILGAALRTWASAYLRSAVVHDEALHTEGLVADGPYRLVRNPLYLGVLLLALGMAPAACRSGAAILLAGIWLFQGRLIGREEAELALTQGEGFRAYLAAVPRLWPALSPRVRTAGRTPHWGQAFLGEGFLWIFALALTAFAIENDSRILGATCAAGFLAYFLVRRLTRVA
jgi:protein-S-isoprenylcysteine O-methyltransferase Ste14